MKKIIKYLVVIYYIVIANITLASANMEDDLVNITDSKIADIDGTDGLDMLANLAMWFKTEIMTIVWVFTIGVFIFIGMKIIMARGNPEEFKKSMLYFVYAIIGVFIIFMAWGLVRLVSTLSL